MFFIDTVSHELRNLCKQVQIRKYYTHNNHVHRLHTPRRYIEKPYGKRKRQNKRCIYYILLFLLTVSLVAFTAKPKAANTKPKIPQYYISTHPLPPSFV